jgi:predicted amidohydrolase
VSAPPAATLRLAVLQTDAVPEDVAANAEAIARAAARVSADLLVTPELSLTGYTLESSAGALARPLGPDAPVPGTDALAGVGGTVLVGLPERTETGHPYNAAAALREGLVRHVHRKRYLPTYGMFDEARHFAAGDALELYRTPEGWRVGVLVCEDLWHPSLAYVLALAGGDVIAVLAAAPGRGVWAGGAAGPFASWDGWVRLARVTAQVHGVYVALANRAGVEGPITFAGGSLVAGPDGELLAQADARAGAVLEVDAERGALDAARACTPHLRDEDVPWLAERLRALTAG